ESHAAKAATTAPAGGEAERQRRLYQITDAGRARFYELVLEPGAYNADFADIFAIKLSCFAYISRDHHLHILPHSPGYLLFTQKHVLTTRQRVATIPAIRDFERVHYLRMLDHKLLLLEADLAWVDRQIADDATLSSQPGEAHHPVTSERE